MALPRLRQVAFAATDLDAVAGELRETLHLGEPYVDDGVGLFGLRNAVFSVGDTFLEVVSPTRADTSAGRYLTRQGGDTGYMVMIQIADARSTRERLHTLGVRTVWDYAEADIIDLHLHPRDLPGPLLALDQAEPVGSWRWGGPAWTESVPEHPPGGLRGLTIAVADPGTAAARWAEVLDVPAEAESLRLAEQQLSFVPTEGRDGIIALTLAIPDGHFNAALDGFVLAGVRIDLIAA